MYKPYQCSKCLCGHYYNGSLYNYHGFGSSGREEYVKGRIFSGRELAVNKFFIMVYRLAAKKNVIYIGELSNAIEVKK